MYHNDINYTVAQQRAQDRRNQARTDRIAAAVRRARRPRQFEIEKAGTPRPVAAPASGA